MITIHDLLEDPVWKREVLLTPPELPSHLYHTAPWRLYVLTRDGKWLKRDFATYREAFSMLKKHLKTCRDACIVSRAVAFAPPARKVKTGRTVERNGKQVPVVKMVPWEYRFDAEDESGHRWCPYCRRPTIFKWFHTHHAFTGDMARILDPRKLRCTICGASTDIAYYERKKL